MRAGVVTETGAIQVETVADPLPGPGELVLRVTSCGICGSDLKSRPAMPHGTVMGHEFCGQVVAVGEPTDGPAPSHPWREGMAAAVLPVFSCGTCAWCRVGEVAHCAAARLVGLGGAPGGFAEYVTASAALTFVEPDPYLPVLALLKELTVAFSVYYRPEEFAEVIDAFATGRIDPTPLVTDTIGLDGLDGAFARLATDPTDGKILVDPRAGGVA